MSPFAAALLLILQTFPVFHRDLKSETPEDRSIRLENYAVALDAATLRATCQGDWAVETCKPKWYGAREDLALTLAMLGFQESGLSRDVQAGNCKDYECDPTKKGKEIIHLARTNWQLHKSKLIEEEWDVMQGLTPEAMQAAAWAATKVWASSYWTCGGKLEGGIAAYAGQSKTCTWSGAPRRVAFYRMIRSRWPKAMKEALANQAPVEPSTLPPVSPGLVAQNP